MKVYDDCKHPLSAQSYYEDGDYICDECGHIY